MTGRPPKAGEIIWTVSDCWEWTGPHSASGYGRHRGRYMHRTMYERYIGPIPAGLELDHLCRNRGCCNPLHLEAVTHAENMRRGYFGSKTHCPNGHAYDAQNTLTSGEGRGCRECKALSRNTTGRRVSASHCPKGHEFTPDNTLTVNTGKGMSRRCAICRRETVRASKRRQKAKAS